MRKQLILVLFFSSSASARRLFSMYDRMSVGTIDNRRIMELLGWVALSVAPALPLILLALHLLSRLAGLIRSSVSAVLPLHESGKPPA